MKPGRKEAISSSLRLIFYLGLFALKRAET
jgi:hypothetical protein